MKEKNKLKLKILEQDEFIELMQKIPNILRTFKDMKGLDTILRKIFLNFFVSGKKVFNTRLNQPFDTVFQQKVLVSAQGGT
jgi:hypothetical protein